MPTAIIDGIATRYEVTGSGPPILMYSPGGFDATLDKWRTQGVYAKIKLLDHLPKQYTCITFDRRESGQSGGRVERVTWARLRRAGQRPARPSRDRARAHHGRLHGLLPGGGVRRHASRDGAEHDPVSGRWAAPNTASPATSASPSHLGISCSEHGLADVVGAGAKRPARSFGEDPRGGPWAAVLRHDRAFAEAYAKQDLDATSSSSPAWRARCSTATPRPGAEPEDLMRLDMPALVVPGRDAAHATSAARYLEECLPKAEYWDVPVAGQTEAAAPLRIMEFLEQTSATA